jgi:PAS domain-containing protein
MTQGSDPMSPQTPSPVIVPKGHADVISGVTRQFQSLFDSSRQCMYIFLDDRNKSCNAKFARLLGYSSPSAWAAVQGSFPSAFVDVSSQDLLVDTYQDAMRDGVGASIPVTWRRRDGSTVDTECILVPVDFEGHRVALHFIEEA